MKLIFFDIDGTIINEKKEMSESTREAIRSARQKGHICVINTGRTWKLVDGFVTGLAEFDGYILGCGTMILWKDRILLEKTFEEELGKRIVEGLRRHRIDAVLEGRENNFHEELSKINSRLFYHFLESFRDKCYGSFEEAPGHFDKFYAYTEKRESMEAFSKEFERELDFVDREGGFFEIVPKGFSKETGMRFLAGHLGISMEDTAAIGDSSNDIPMLKCAGASIAMGNASEEVKALADYVTADVNEGGISRALEWLGI